MRGEEGSLLELLFAPVKGVVESQLSTRRAHNMEGTSWG